jgi:tRNA G18 (ribose-2'-O)-methylase SpoU
MAEHAAVVKRDLPRWRGVRFTTVTDPDDERLWPYTRLSDAEHRRGLEASGQTFVIEGVTAIRTAVRSPYRVRSVLVTEAKLRALADDLEPADHIDVFVADHRTMNAVVGFDIHRGAVAIGERRPLPGPEALLSEARTVAILEAINDHENLGAIARSAVALGVDAALLDATCADPLYRRCVRVSLGRVLQLPYGRARSGPAAINHARAAGLTTVALTPSPGANAIDQLATALGPRPVALVIGSEATGLSPATLAAADHLARVPMRAGIDSLNVGHAAAIAFHVFGRA